MENKKSKITVKDVSRIFFSPSGERIEALKDINLEVEDAFSAAGRDIGEFRVLLGPSGCGVTLHRMIAGLTSPPAARYWSTGSRSPLGQRPRHGISEIHIVPPNHGRRGLRHEDQRCPGGPAQRPERLLKSVGLTEFANVTRDVSGGAAARCDCPHSRYVLPSSDGRALRRSTRPAVTRSFCCKSGRNRVQFCLLR
jgi:ABC-type glutathione transport system ATPase component